MTWHFQQMDVIYVFWFVLIFSSSLNFVLYILRVISIRRKWHPRVFIFCKLLSYLLSSFFFGINYHMFRFISIYFQVPQLPEPIVCQDYLIVGQKHLYLLIPIKWNNTLNTSWICLLINSNFFAVVHLNKFSWKCFVQLWFYLLFRFLVAFIYETGIHLPFIASLNLATGLLQVKIVCNSLLRTVVFSASCFGQKLLSTYALSVIPV